MKYFYTSILVLLTSVFSIAQVGIDTDNPEATLDVNGNMRIRQSPEVEKTDYVLSSDEEGFVRQIALSSLNLEAVNLEGASFIAGVSNNLTNTRTPGLDLWTIQEEEGIDALKRYYFLGQNVLVTLPKNISVLGDKTARVLTFIVVKNDEFNGEQLSRWNAVFQTKLFQEDSDSFQGTNAGVFLYQNTFSGSDLTSGLNPVDTDGNVGGFRRRVYLRGQSSIRDREINFYDFGGKWIMTVND